ncbi:hypothetical protein [Bradyrhizobium sp. CCGUVB14]|uniref:hypothetical protein n=1 Tax=Bradyrhizobium sp. CCGUVB14 TaxID=2949628 RepID=UPI0020B1DF94|nr:hypothetical protein [Bradyrhizobium sp. CCGUVB14]MCP3446183.1 hypothetical protein [Bradyrhizobium sp. CCGUVB14]
MAEQKMPNEYWTTAEVMKGIFETKTCLAKPHSSEACEGKIIAAHTIPYSQLAKIASDGHVYAIGATLADLARSDGQFTMKKYGIRNFSVLNCFCATHDKKIFAHIEDDELVFDGHQLTLLQYRTLASELYRKVSSYQSTLHQIEQQQSKKPKDKEAIEFLKAQAIGTLAGVRDIGTAFDACATNLFGQKYDQVSALVVHFKKLPSVMTVGSFLPQYDYNAKPLQLIYDLETIADIVCFNILAAKDHAAVIMLWPKGQPKMGRQLADSFIAQNSSQYSALSIQTAFEYLENTCVSMGWWDDQKPIIHKVLLNRMQSGANPLEARASSCLTFSGVNFDQWDYDRHEFLNADERSG